MRIASYNVESLFNRAKALNPPLDWNAGKPALEAYSRVNSLLAEPIYTDTVKTELLKLLADLGLTKADDGGKFARLRQNRGHLLNRSKGKTTITASGRADWVGWLELETEPINELATRHTAMVLRDLDAHIQGVIEADNRIALEDFSAIMLDSVGGMPFEHVMLIDGNDRRGIDVGIMSKRGYDLTGIRSHVDDKDGQSEIFSRDCPEYTVRTPQGETIVVLVNHLKSKGYGAPAVSNARRELQADRVAKIYRRLIKEGKKSVVVLGDFNDTPDSRPLAPLLQKTNLRDVSEHPTFEVTDRPGTYGTGAKSNKIDYVLLSPALFKRVTGGGLFRKGVWGGKNGTIFDHYPTMTKAEEAASDHAAIYADIAAAS
ncbi:MAG: endonuclease/exonuclease/phosphatase family protein [Thermoleophilaceae bacterium]|nr:endonuclease/exonuclease/phosphatase family protein [Thermoleophilaceae bacterium]